MEANFCKLSISYTYKGKYGFIFQIVDEVEHFMNDECVAFQMHWIWMGEIPQKLSHYDF